MQERRVVSTLNPAAVGRAAAIAGIAGAVIVADQLTKTWAVDHLATGPRHVLGPLDLILSYNTGVAFSIGSGMGPVIVAVVAIVAVAFLGFARGAPGVTGVAGSGLVLGGALSNLGDRVFRSNHGAVIDFIHLPHWATFNVADSCIVVGIGVFLVASVRRR